MRNVSHVAAMRRNRKAVPERRLPLFEWAEMANPPLATLPLATAARMIARRFALSPSHARLIAEQAGFAMEVQHG